MKKEIMIPVATGVSIGLALSIYRKRVIDTYKQNAKNMDAQNNADAMQEKSENEGFAKTKYIRLR